jgi:DNA modification methylase
MTTAAVLQRSDAPKTRLSVPRRGHVLSTIAETYGGPVRTAVDILTAALEQDGSAGPQMPLNFPTLEKQAFIVRRPAYEMEAWHLCTRWLVGVALGTLRQTDTLEDAAEWFGHVGLRLHTNATRRLNAASQREALEQLRSIADPCAFADLLPYVLDPHGPGSRLSVMRDPSTRAARDRKRTNGVFYTPADVAEHMAALAFTNLRSEDNPVKVLDPACGTGVFLRAALAFLRGTNPNVDVFSIATHSLHGVDIDPWAVDASAYVLLHDVLAHSLKKSLTPGAVWQKLRRNLFVFDALSLDPASAAVTGVSKKETSATGVPITALFPEMGEGAQVILGNPPYASLTGRTDLATLQTRFKTLPTASATSDMHPLFLEQLMRLAAPAAAGALVLPLSIAFSGGKQYVQARRLIQRTAGTWRFSFFDREPHALFGEDVKTRNTIVAWARKLGETSSNVMTGPLLKWRGDSRARMFQSIRHTEIPNAITTGIPKLSGATQAETLGILMKKRIHLSSFVTFVSGTTLEQTLTADNINVFVGGTAYNFLNVFFQPPAVLTPSAVLSTNTVHRLRCARTSDAFVTYALLSSRISFWLWHIIGDGFHVSRRFLEELPLGFSLFNKKQLDLLETLGRDLWKEAKTHSVASFNRGRASLAFPASRMPKRQREIDQVIISAAGLPDSFLTALDGFVDSVISAEPCGKFNLGSPEDIQMKAISPAEIKERSKVTKEEWREYTKTVWHIANTSHDEHPAVFPVEIPMRLTKLFSFYGDTVLDPFAGAGSTARAAIPLGRRMICVDQNPRYVEIIRKECRGLKNGHAADFKPLEAVHADSRKMSFVPDHSVGLVVTSPPYWNKADYGPGRDNLGGIDSYPDFIEATKPVWEECYRTLMPGRKLCLVTANVNQHTDMGLLTFPLATDFAVLLRKIGFVMVNEIIWSKDGTGGKWGSYGAQRPIFGSYPYPPNFLFKNVHEYILIFAKPAATKTKGPKVRNYHQLMESATVPRLLV